MIPGIDPKVDYAFKRLFGREQNAALLIHLLNAILQSSPGERIVAVEILNPFNDKDSLDDKLSILDIKVRDGSGRQFNIEMQLLVPVHFPKRILYYWARFHQGQLQESGDYRTLRPTITICFVNAPLFPDVADHHLVFELRERQHGIVFTGDLAVHMLDLSKFARPVEELRTPLDRWLYFLRHAEQLDTEALPATLDQPEIHRAMGELQMLTQSDLERERYEARHKMQSDIITSLAEARDQGRAEGLEKGLEEGLEKGLEKGRAEGLIGRIHFGQRLLRRPLTPMDQLRALPVADLEALARRLEVEITQSLAPDAGT